MYRVGFITFLHFKSLSKAFLICVLIELCPENFFTTILNSFTSQSITVLSKNIRCKTWTLNVSHVDDAELRDLDLVAGKSMRISTRKVVINILNILVKVQRADDGAPKQTLLDHR